MCSFNEIMKTLEFVCSSNVKLTLKKFVCEVEYYTKEPLEDVFYVICSILNSTDGSCYDKCRLGVLLGFSMENISGEGFRMYQDKGEVGIFDEIISLLKQEHLVREERGKIFLTELGRISLVEGVHYRFFACNQSVYEHYDLRSALPMALQMFPFYDEMGIYASMEGNKQIWPDEEDVYGVIHFEKDQLKKRLELQSKEKLSIYRAKLHEYYEKEAKNVTVNLYKSKLGYVPVVMYGGKVAERATRLLSEELNSQVKRRIVLECLFQKLWNDKATVLSYDVLEPYLDIVDYEELSKDSRTVWCDAKLWDVIVEKATPTCWKNITRNCEILVLQNVIQKYKNQIDWRVLSERIDDSFLISHFLDYPWDLQVISYRSAAVVEKLILLQKETVEDWDWSELEGKLSPEFIIANLDKVSVNLSPYTKDTPEVREAIIGNVDKLWDWRIIEETFHLQFILDYIAVFGQHFRYAYLFDRVFGDFEWSKKFLGSESFRRVISEACKIGGALSSSLFNDAHFDWSNYQLIDFFTANGLISWKNTEYSRGFGCNGGLKWTNEFFDRYSDFVEDKIGQQFVSSHIEDVDVLIQHPCFGWDWEQISSNGHLLSDKRLYDCFGDKLVWSKVIDNQNGPQMLQSISLIDKLIGDDLHAWTIFSDIAEIDYVKSKYEFPWNWGVLTKRMFEHLKLENIGNPNYIDKWDWSYLSEKVPYDFLRSNLKKYSNYWDWNVVFPRILSKEERLNYEKVGRIALVLGDKTNEEVRRTAWSALTSQYTFNELKQAIRDTAHKEGFMWDLSLFYQHREFYVLRDIEECRDIIDWKLLSSSSSIDEKFKYNPNLGLKQQAWIQEIRQLICDSKNQWDYYQLSHFCSLRDELWFVSQFKEKIDWSYITVNSSIFCEKNKQKLNEIIEGLKNYIDFKVLVQRSDVDVEQIIKINPNADYDFNSLIKRGVLKATVELIEQYRNYAWDWYVVSSSKSFIPNDKFLVAHINDNLNWKLLSVQNLKSLWSNLKLIVYLAKKQHICSKVDWFALSSREYFPISKLVFDVVPLAKLNWQSLSGSERIAPYIDEYIQYIDWKILTRSAKINVFNIDFLAKYKDYVDWDYICKSPNFELTNNVLELFAGYIDWNIASKSHTIRFSSELVQKFSDCWNWSALVKNIACTNVLQISKFANARQANVVEFLSHFPRRPMAYHFTHMETAIKIIREMKLKSRKIAEGHFSENAGSNVYRTNKAHRFARFYFAPKSPTQFYNECLGKDSGDRYYKKAFDLKLPKCPLPVFFVFDVEEILSAFPDLCYYSNGNMQCDAARVFKVVEEPNMIKAQEIFINSFDTKSERQQEFLVDGELDFSNLRNVGIFCYNEYQAQMLRNELSGTKWENIIECNQDLYDRCNKELSYEDGEDIVYIHTYYNLPFEFRVSYAGDVPPEILNKDDITCHRGRDIFLSSSLKIKKDIGFDVYFEVREPRFGSWLIYRNKLNK